MRKLLRWLFRIVGVLALLVVVLASTVYIVSSRKLHRQYDLTVPGVAVATTADARLRGRHIAEIRGCVSCHGEDLAGAKVTDDPAMGRIYGPNLTTGSGSRVIGYSNSDWVRAVRHGVARDGHPLLIMPSKDYVELSDEDLGNLLGYIQSVAAVDRPSEPVAPGPVSRALLTLGKLRLSADVIDHTIRPAATIMPALTPEYGRYLASTCTGCHNPHLSGGKITEGPPDWPAAANLTRGTGTAVAGWSEANFIQALRAGTEPSGRALSPVMPRELGKMNDLELKALWSYIQTLPPAPTGHSPS